MPGVLPFDPVAIDQATTVAITVGRYRFDGVLVMTTAGARYDHPGACIPVDMYDGSPDGPVIRYLLVRRQDVAFQLARYQSGLYPAGPTDLLDDATVIDKLMARCLAPTTT